MLDPSIPSTFIVVDEVGDSLGGVEGKFSDAQIGCSRLDQIQQSAPQPTRPKAWIDSELPKVADIDTVIPATPGGLCRVIQSNGADETTVGYGDQARALRRSPSGHVLLLKACDILEAEIGEFAVCPMQHRGQFGDIRLDVDWADQYLVVCEMELHLFPLSIRGPFWSMKNIKRRVSRGATRKGCWRVAAYAIVTSSNRPTRSADTDEDDGYRDVDPSNY